MKFGRVKGSVRIKVNFKFVTDLLSMSVKLRQHAIISLTVRTRGIRAVHTALLVYIVWGFFYLLRPHTNSYFLHLLSLTSLLLVPDCTWPFSDSTLTRLGLFDSFYQMATEPTSAQVCIPFLACIDGR